MFWRRKGVLTWNGSDRQFSAFNFLIPNDVTQRIPPRPRMGASLEMEAIMIDSLLQVI